MNKLHVILGMVNLRADDQLETYIMVLWLRVDSREHVNGRARRRVLAWQEEFLI